jgi:hypothetical protein
MRNSLLTLLIIGIAANSSATVINIPSDYPTIQQGIDASADGDTVLVQPGTYYENINFNGHNIVLGSLFLTTGDTSYIEQTVIDGDSLYTDLPLISFYSGEDSTASITGFAIQNNYGWDCAGGILCDSSSPIISNNIIRDNYVYYNGGGILCRNFSYAIIKKNVISNNTTVESMGGGGIYCSNYSVPIIIENIISENQGACGGGISCVQNSDAIIITNILISNTASDNGGAIYCMASDPLIAGNSILNNASLLWGGGIACILNSNPIIANNLIIQNSALAWFGFGGEGGGSICYQSNPILINNVFNGNYAESFGGGLFCWMAYPQVHNNILWANIADSNGQGIYLKTGSPIIEYCNIQDTLWPGVGNISVNPLFRDSANGNFHLMSTACGDPYNSPCIDAGDPNILDSLLDCSWGLGTILSDMGAYGGGDSASVGIWSGSSLLPERYMLLQNYPNPFNASTTIEFSLPEEAYVDLSIYDLLGREIEVLAKGLRQAGHHLLTWDASDYPSGIYFAQLDTKGYSENIKMVLLK